VPRIGCPFAPRCPDVIERCLTEAPRPLPVAGGGQPSSSPSPGATSRVQGDGSQQVTVACHVVHADGDGS